jgi:beta-phosphoglucomutase-like phosphatase (HAD superfamily)
VGVIAGKAAGAKVIAVPNKFTSDQDMSKADLIVSSLSDIKWENLVG